ncbi:MAG: TPM domain-containing protein [Bacteroidales bacterium]|nr:TPM domain-containing protein [Bacteroidales bacterium]
MKRWALFISLLCSTMLLWAQWTPTTVPNPLTTEQSFIADPDHLLSDEDKAAFNEMAYRLDDSAGVQFAVAVLNSIDDHYEPFEFGVELYNHWGIGRKDRGVLLLIVMETHDWQFHTGYGMEEIITDALAKRIGEEEMVPYFRKDEYGQGILAATRALSKILLSEDPKAAVALMQEQQKQERWSNFRKMVYIGWALVAVIGVLVLLHKPKKRNHYRGAYDILLVNDHFAKITPNSLPNSYTRPGLNVEKFFMLSLVSALIPIAVNTEWISENPFSNFFFALFVCLVLDAIIAQWRICATAAESSTPQEHMQKLQNGNQLLPLRIVIMPLIFVPYYFFYKRKVAQLKEAGYPCPFCHLPTSLASKVTVQQHLTGPALIEQQLNVFEYQYFECPSGHCTEVSYKGPNYAKYITCSHCGARAVLSEGSHTVKQPSMLASGLERTDYTCQNCHNHYFTTKVLPKLMVASTAAGMGRHSGGFGGGFGGGGFGGGHSFGGGFTGGGGAGGKW